MNKLYVSILIATSVFAGSVCATPPSGFNQTREVQTRMPQGFHSKITTISQIQDSAKDDQIVVLRGTFVDHLKGDKYLFRDQNGATIVCELDDDKDWGHVVKDQPVQIRAQVDKDFRSLELDVLEAKIIK